MHVAPPPPPASPHPTLGRAVWRSAGRALPGHAARRARPRLLVLLAGAALAAAAAAGTACGEAPGPPRHRPAVFVEAAEERGLTFRMEFLPGEQGQTFKINLYDHGAGVAVADVNGDGHDDLYFCNQLGSNALFLNDGTGRFRDVTAAAGVAVPDRISVAATFADYDGDGDQDLYVTTTRGGNLLFRNRGDGTFEDVTEAAGLALTAHSEQAFFFDADGDGDLDLYVTNTAEWTTEDFNEGGRYWLGASTLEDLVDSRPEHDRFYLQRGDGTFEDATERAGLSGAGWSGDVAVFDADDDGDLDLFTCNMFGRSTLYLNDGKGRFTDGTSLVLGRTPWGAIGARAFDFDGDGRLDLFVTDMHSDMWMPFDFDPTRRLEQRKFRTMHGLKGIPSRLPAKSRMNFDRKAVTFGNALYRAQADGRYAEVSEEAGVETLWPWGIAVADYDGDGHEDVFIPTGMGYPYKFWRSPLLINRGDGTFFDAAAEAGLDPLPGGPLGTPIGRKPAAKSLRAAAVADVDGDGRPDLVVSPFNERAYLYLNRSPERAWVGFRLVGRGGNRDAIGATVRLRLGDRTLVRMVQAAGGYLAQSSRTLLFGLGSLPPIDEMEVRWPDGTVERKPPPALGRVHTLRHPSIGTPPAPQSR